MAERIVLKNSMSKKKKVTKATINKIKKLEEFDARLKALDDFLEVWNKWRELYDLKAVKIKTAGQATSIEKSLAFVKEHDLDLNIFIGTIHRAYFYKRYNPSFAQGYADYSLEFYDKFFDDVVGDIEEENYMDEALR